MVDFTTLHPNDFDRNLFNFLVDLQTRVGGARMHCMRADMYSITILAISLKLLIIKKSHQQQEEKTNGGNKDGSVHA